MIALSHPWALLLTLPAAWLLWRARRRHVQTVAVANLFLWLDAPAANETHASTRRTPPWLVWLQAAVLVTLAVAIAGPSVTASRPEAALIVDVSLSMSARDAGSTRLALAQRAAQVWLDDQPPRRLIRIIAAGNQPEPVETSRAGSSKAAIGRLVVNENQKGADDTIVAAIDMARRETSGPIMVISDRPAPAASAALNVAWQQVGAPADNVAITALAGTGDGRAILEVSNFGAAPRAVDVDVTGGPAAWHERVQLAASSARAFVLPPAADRTLSATLSGDAAGNAITADDHLQARIRATKTRVALIGANAAIQAALEAMPDLALNVEGKTSLAPGADVIVTTAALASRERSSLVFATGAAVPVITRHDVNGVRRIDVAVDLLNSDWTLTPAFPIFVADSIDWLSGRATPGWTKEQIAGAAESDTRRAEPPHLDALAAPAPPQARILWRVLALLGLLGVAVEAALRRPAVYVRAIAALAVGAALAGLPMPFADASRAAVLALDASASMSGNQRATSDRARRETENAGGNDRVSSIRFGGAETDIAAGLREARAALPPSGDRRLLLISDGQQTAGDSAAEARNSKAADVPIDVVPVDSRAPAFISRVDAPMSARAGAPVPVRVTVRGSRHELLRLTVARDGHELDSRRIVLDEAGEAAIALVDRPLRPGVTFYRAALVDDRLGLQLSESGAATSIAGARKTLLISDRAATTAALFGSSSAEVISVAPPAAPDTREGLSPFSAIVIDAIAPHRLSERQREAVTSAVSLDGAGLLFLGSRESLDASEFSPGPFSDALPIDFTVLPTPASASSLALLVDISGSMASTSDGVTKIDAARDAIARAMAIVPNADAVEVVGFAAQPVLLIGPGDPRDASAVSEKLKTLSPSGSTALAPAVAQAAAWLKQSPNARRRLLLVTDGKTSVADAEAARAAVRGQSIEVSVVTIGRDAERDWLTELAASTGGRAYFPNRLTDLAREVAREAARGASGREINERVAIRGGAHPLAPGDPAPALDGYIAGRLRDGAIAAWKGRADDAVLAAWPRGLGRVAVFGSDVGGAWGAPLRFWRPNASFWTRALEWVSRDDDPASIDAVLTLLSGEPRLVVDLGEPSTASATTRALPSVTATVAAPSGQTFTTNLHPVTSGRFEGRVPLGETGDYRATITVMDTDRGTETRAPRGWYWAGDGESESRGVNLPLLEEIARVSGGRLLPALGEPVAASDSVFGAPRARRSANAAPWLLLAAAALLAFDYIRRAFEVS